MSDISLIDRSVEKTNMWLNELSQELSDEDCRFAFPEVLRTVLAG